MEDTNIQIVNKLKQLGWKISTMESCTGGNVIDELTNVEGASYITDGGYVTYSNSAKIRMGVHEHIIESYGVYSVETAIAMAKACKDNNKCNVGIGVTGTLSNVDPNNTDSIALKAFYAIAIGTNTVYTFELDIPSGRRDLQKKYVTEQIINKLNKILEEQLKKHTQPRYIKTEHIIGTIFMHLLSHNKTELTFKELFNISDRMDIDLRRKNNTIVIISTNEVYSAVNSYGTFFCLVDDTIKLSSTGEERYHADKERFEDMMDSYFCAGIPSDINNTMLSVLKSI